MSRRRPLIGFLAVVVVYVIQDVLSLPDAASIVLFGFFVSLYSLGRYGSTSGIVTAALLAAATTELPGDSLSPRDRLGVIVGEAGGT